MPSEFVNLQAALRARIQALIPGASVFDHVPQDTPAEFFTVGPDFGLPFDTKTSSGVLRSVEVNIYSSHRGLAQVKARMDTLYAGLQQHVLAVAGVTVRPLRFEFSEAFEEPDGSRGVLRFGTAITPQ